MNVSNKFSFLIRQLLGLGCGLDQETAGVRNIRKSPYYTVCVKQALDPDCWEQTSPTADVQEREWV